MNPAPAAAAADPAAERTPTLSYRNWARMHLGHGARPKIAHRTWLGAWWHLRSNQARFPAEADLICIYPCWFRDDNTSGRKHYHVGHVRGARKALTAPKPGTLYVGVFATRAGFEVRTFGTRPPLCRPPYPTPGQALSAWLREPGSAYQDTAAPEAPAADRYTCPHGDYTWHRPGIGTPAPHCPAHQVPLGRA